MDNLWKKTVFGVYLFASNSTSFHVFCHRLPWTNPNMLGHAVYRLPRKTALWWDITLQPYRSLAKTSHLFDVQFASEKEISWNWKNRHSGWWFGTFFTFPWECHHTSRRSYFHRGGYTTNQYNDWFPMTHHWLNLGRSFGVFPSRPGTRHLNCREGSGEWHIFIYIFLFQRWTIISEYK